MFTQYHTRKLSVILVSILLLVGIAPLTLHAIPLANPNHIATATQIGVVLPTDSDPRWVQDATRLTNVLSAAGYSFEILFSQNITATEKTNVETLISQGIKVLIILTGGHYGSRGRCTRS